MPSITLPRIETKSDDDTKRVPGFGGTLSSGIPRSLITTTADNRVRVSVRIEVSETEYYRPNIIEAIETKEFLARITGGAKANPVGTRYDYTDGYVELYAEYQPYDFNEKAVEGIMFAAMHLQGMFEKFDEIMKRNRIQPRDVETD